MLRRLPFVLACAGALFLVVLTVSQLSAARAGDEVVEGATPFLTDDGLRTMRGDLERIDTTLTGMAADPAYPASIAGDEEVAGAAARLPAVRGVADKVIGNLEDRQQQFDSAAELPGAGLDLQAGVIGLLALAVLALLAGLTGAVRPTRWAAGAVLAAGVLVAGVPLALGHPGKASDTDAMLDSLRPFSREKVEVREQGLADVRLVLDSYAGTAIPAEDLAATDAAVDRFAALVVFSGEVQPLLVEATPRDATTTVWLSVGAGAALVVGGAAGLLTARRRAG